MIFYAVSNCILWPVLRMDLGIFPLGFIFPTFIIWIEFGPVSLINQPWNTISALSVPLIGGHSGYSIDLS